LVSLYPLEKGFVLGKPGSGFAGDLLKDFIMGLGKNRINHLQEMPDYFADLEMAYDFYRQLEGRVFRINGMKCRYKIVSSFDEIDPGLNKDIKTINLILTVEGANVFNSGLQLMGRPLNKNEFLDNIDKVRKWDHRLFFIGMAHHFYNELCGHARSLHGIAEWSSNQEEGLDSGFTPFGIKVLHKFLDNSEGKRILIDTKHMSVVSRKQYYRILDNDYPSDNIPVIVSHSAVNGLRSADEQVVDNQHTKGKLQLDDINVFDDEIIRIATSGGLLGIQLDERRAGSVDELRNSSMSLSTRKMLFKKSRLLWNQIQHIAETLDREDLFAWGIQAVGSDFDGLINPLNGFWTAEQMPLLDSYLEKHAYNYINSPQAEELNSFNRINPDEIIERFMFQNAWEFLRRAFH
jgi:microsomal dipeptidase-like Zn-dependent dipeptidase